ncbi:3-dehydroquinate synthase [Evansella sp. AB-rgal1]|uniref:3-dehydroquinate synthase n=1 Tax=Evansella sp. AB-rgal1 TaxID=3242696 RepID=UPI00359EDDDC
MKMLRVNSSQQTYSIVIEKGSRKEAYNYIQKHVAKKPTSYFIITDDKVASLYLEEVLRSFPNDSKVETHIVPNGEKAKSFRQYEELLTKALQAKLDRKSMIIALGGGVIGDLAGFVAATFMRGIPFVQIPTTLLAHDSSVGGKVGINHPLGKNLIGAFHQPSLVLYDPEMLLSLPIHEWRSGFAEVIKHGFIADESFLQWLTDNIRTLEDWDLEVLTQLLARSIQVKATIVEQDERESGIRAYLNFGHTLGHAIEAELGYGVVTHGEAVVVGMAFALPLSETYFNKTLSYEPHMTYLKNLGYNINIPEHISKEKLIERMKIDKKSYNGSIHFVLLKHIGDPQLVEISEEELLKQLSSEVD